MRQIVQRDLTGFDLVYRIDALSYALTARLT
jgi:hypothetical protein